MKAALPGAVVLLASGLWLPWPWIVPLVSPVPTPGPGSDLVVVLDGGSGRFAAADRIGQALPQPPSRLLIRCPRGTLPPQPTPELLQGFDTATQITALAHWLRHQPSLRSAGLGATTGCYRLFNSAPTSCSTRSTTAIGALAISSASRLRQSRLRS